MSAAVVRKKQDDKHLLALRELVNAGAGGSNRQCFDCGQKGPTYVNMTIGSFVCTRCSGVLRGLTPPHRVKSISMATFTQEEIDFIRSHGNELCSKTWLGLWDPKRTVNQDQRELMIDKYERKRYYLEPASPLKSLTNAATVTSSSSASASSSSSNSIASAFHDSTGAQNGQANEFKQQSKIALDGMQLTSQATQRNGGSDSRSRPQQHPHHQQQQDALMVLANNGRLSVNGLNATEAAALNHANGIRAGDTDFVANFGTANIFVAAPGATAKGNTDLSSSTYNNINHNVSNNNNHDYGKIQPKPQQPIMMNNNLENFADFDHAPIYNATISVLPIPNCVNSNSNLALGKNKITPDEDRYAALKDLDEQLRESKSSTGIAVSTGVPAMDVFGNMNGNNNNEIPAAVAANSSNPFKSQQHQIANSGLANPFAAGQHVAANKYAHAMAVIPNNSSMNSRQPTAAMVQQQQQHLQLMNTPSTATFFNYTNGGDFNMITPVSTGINGCGFGTMQQQITSNSSVFNNPFASATARALNTNNPFL